MTPLKIMLKLFDSCIAPILLYGSEVWAPFMNLHWKQWDTAQIEKIQFLKRLLVVNRLTTNVWIRRNINYIKYIESKDPQTLIKPSANYEILHIGKRNSLYSLLKKYEQNLINHNNDNEGIRGLNKAKLCKIIKEEFNTVWQTQVNSFPKADTYRQFKNRVKFESYLTDNKNRKLSVTCTKYRLSDQCIMI